MVAVEQSKSARAREPEDVLAMEDDTEVFTKGFCHALASNFTGYLGRQVARLRLSISHQRITSVSRLMSS